MAIKNARVLNLCFLWLLVSTVLDCHSWKKKLPKPYRNLVLYFHDIIYNGKNVENATSAIVAAPEGANLTILAGNNHFGNLAVFDDPITLDNNLHSPPVDYKGTITFNGVDPILVKYRDIPVVGGTGDFLMARGIATINTDAYEGEVYFRLRVNITLYECY
ncbi:hypothetical protein SUGI_0946050 [Cryptomeria japonica]|nr:hypothetical protein SUGI_0946050 [Cryptomeria japonica]